MSAKRVLHVLPHRGGGGEIYVSMLERMTGFKHERFYLSAGRTAIIGARSIPSRWVHIAWNARSTDLIHLHGDAATAIMLPVIGAQSTIVTTHGLSLLRRTTGPVATALAVALRSAVRRADGVICTSEAERDELAEIVPPDLRPTLSVVYPGIDPPSPATEQDRIATRQALEVGPDTVLVLFVGRLDAMKAPLSAARAVNAVYASGIQVKLVVAGDGPQRAQLEKLAGHAVHPIGHWTDVSRLMRAADIFVHPSEREGMSLALLEAMANGLAIVASRCTSNPEAIGDTGLLYASGDELALAAELSRLATDAELRTALGRAAALRASATFAPSESVARVERIYHGALRAGHRG